MNPQSKIFIQAQDCSPIVCNEVESGALFYFVSEVDSKIYNFSIKPKEIEPIIYFDYKRRCWMANRYIGECEFFFNHQTYVLKINPRFGNELLLKMFEYIYTTKLPPSYHQLSKQKIVDIHKLVISLLWISLLKKALKHGLLKQNKKIKEQGAAIRGKFLIKESLIDIKLKNLLRYEYQIKEINNVPNKIIFKAYQLLKTNYFLNDILLSNHLIAELKKLSNVFNSKVNIDTTSYQTIKYHNLYAGYQPLVELSWQIIKSNELGLENSNKLGKSFYLDMAEVWELFVHKIITKNMIPYGWNLLQNEYPIYVNTFYKRKIIPDLVLEKENKILVIDAKYKRMFFRKEDLDRTDLFQIHTYSYYFDESNKKVFSTLIYPLENKNEKAIEKQYIFDKLNHKNSFFIEGIDVSDSCFFAQNIEVFINSIKQKLTQP